LFQYYNMSSFKLWDLY